MSVHSGDEQYGDDVAEAVAAYIESDPEYRMAVLRRDLFKVVRKWRPPVDMDPVEAAGLDLSPRQLATMDANLAALNDWIDRFQQARQTGLRLIRTPALRGPGAP